MSQMSREFENKNCGNEVSGNEVLRLRHPEVSARSSRRRGEFDSSKNGTTTKATSRNGESFGLLANTIRHIYSM